ANCSNVIWFKQLLVGMNIEIKDLEVILCDNTSVINISKNPIIHTKTKHISIKYHFMRELVQDKEVRLEFVNTKEKNTDIFTKSLPKDAFLYLRGKLGAIPLSEAH
ncbi:Ty1/Copia family ribonuclease HI, partial [Paludifilum halophilum]